MSMRTIRRELASKNNTKLDYSNMEIEVLSEVFNDNSISRGLSIITFSNCIFTGNELLFEGITKEQLLIRFIDCSFECYLKISDCKFLGLHFMDTKKISTQVDIYGNTIVRFYFKNRDRKSENVLNGNIEITGNIILQKLDFQNLNHTSGEFVFTQNELNTKAKNAEVNNNKLNASFSNSKFSNPNFSETAFGQEISFDHMVLINKKNHLNFNDCIFGKVYFNETDFGSSAYFNGSIFNGDVLFVGSQNLSQTDSDFSGCSVNQNFYFNSSAFKTITIKNVTFKERVSFENSQFNKISFERVVFEKPAFFDDIEILNIEKCNRKTIRVIKQQLQKTDNRIDYNKFKAYELNAYRRELKKSQWKDRFILWLNNYSSRHGLDWVRSALLTLTAGLIVFSFYYVLEHYAWEIDLSGKGFSHFFIGYFKYLVPSYKSPFEYGLQNGWLYLPFLFGKILITYGIYQTIVSFRKFRL